MFPPRSTVRWRRPMCWSGRKVRAPATIWPNSPNRPCDHNVRGGPAPLSRATTERIAQAGVSTGGKNQAAFFSVFGIFFLTLLLAGQAVGTMAEEKSNKVIEVLAAAVPLESVFLGKLLGMFGSACLFVAFWGTIAVSIGNLIPGEAARGFCRGRPGGRSPRLRRLVLSPISRWPTCCSARCSWELVRRHRRFAKSR